MYLRFILSSWLPIKSKMKNSFLLDFCEVCNEEVWLFRSRSVRVQQVIAVSWFLPLPTLKIDLDIGLANNHYRGRPVGVGWETENKDDTNNT